MKTKTIRVDGSSLLIKLIPVRDGDEDVSAQVEAYIAEKFSVRPAGSEERALPRERGSAPSGKG